MYTIYKITNLVNRKCYIGQTKNSLKQRFKAHKNDKNASMHNIIQKYGVENFSIVAIDYANNRSEAIEKEVFWTIFFKSTDSDYGYNKVEGDGMLKGEKNPNFGKHLPLETRKKISNTLKGRYVGEKNPNFGKHPSKETLEKVSGQNHWTTRKKFTKEALKKKHDALYRKPTFRSRPVRCVETGEVQPFAKEFHYKYGYDGDKILECCKGRRKTHHGLHWEYAD